MTPKIAPLPLPETVIDADFQNTLTVRLGSHKIATADAAVSTLRR